MSDAFRCVALVAATLCLAWTSPARAEQQLWAAAYVDWTFQDETPGVGLAQTLWIPQPATASFFTLNWEFVGGEGGYIGLQSNEVGAGNARFSLWNATAARGPACRRFDGEGEGMTCEVPVTIAAGALYRVHMQRGEADAQGQWWIGSLEKPDGARVEIGALRVARTLRMIAPDSVHDFSEYWGDAVPACRSVPLSAAAFGAPTLLREGGGAIVAANPAGRRPERAHHCRTGRERTGAVAGHRKLSLAHAPAMLITLGGDAAGNAAHSRGLAAQGATIGQAVRRN